MFSSRAALGQTGTKPSSCPHLSILSALPFLLPPWHHGPEAPGGHSDSVLGKNGSPLAMRTDGRGVLLRHTRPACDLACIPRKKGNDSCRLAGPSSSWASGHRAWLSDPLSAARVSAFPRLGPQGQLLQESRAIADALRAVSTNVHWLRPTAFLSSHVAGSEWPSQVGPGTQRVYSTLAQTQLKSGSNRVVEVRAKCTYTHTLANMLTLVHVCIHATLSHTHTHTHVHRISGGSWVPWLSTALSLGQWWMCSVLTTLSPARPPLRLL